VALEHKGVHLLANVLLKRGIYYIIGRKKIFIAYIRKHCSLLGGIDQEIKEGQTLLLSQIIVGIGGILIVVVVVLLEKGQFSLTFSDHHVGEPMQGAYVTLVELVLRSQAENEVALQPDLRLTTLHNRSNAGE